MKKIYDTPTLELVIFRSNDIITSSTPYFYDEKEEEHVHDISGWFN